MNKYGFSFFIIASIMLLGCSIDAPCEKDERYSENGECVKCYQYIDASGNGYHLDDEERCTIDTDNVCGNGKVDCQSLDNVTEAHCQRGICSIVKCMDDYVLSNNKCQLDIDTDFDGIGDIFDPCPNNPTKWEDKWWNKDKTEGIRCNDRDTDRDGVDDSEDDCKTNPNITKLESGQDCGWMEVIELENGETHTYYYIYNAMDLYNLYKEGKLVPQEKSNEQYKYGTCIDDEMWTCLGEGWCIILSCDSCEYDDDNYALCFNIQHDNKFSIILNNDINLDDIHDDEAGIGTIFDGANCSMDKWTTLETLAGAFFDGNNHKIYYQRNNNHNQEESVRCSIPDALFNSVIGTHIYDLNIDFDMRGIGHALLTNTLDSSYLNTMHVSGIVENLSEEEEEGMGSLAGIISQDYNIDTFFDNIHLNNVTVTADYSDHVGGLIGKTISNFYYDTYAVSNEHISLESVSVSGRDYVGGVIGSGEFWFNDAEIQIDSVSGYDYVGGFCGSCSNFYDAESERLINQVTSVSGNKNVGGFAGQWKGILTQKSIINRIESIIGNIEIGGFIGAAYDIELSASSSTVTDFIIYNFIKSIKNSEKLALGGFIGHTNLNNNDSYEISHVYNHAVHIESSHVDTGASGFVSRCEYPCIISNVWNEVDSIFSLEFAAGFISVISNNADIRNVINRVGSIQAACPSNNCKPSGGFVSEWFKYDDPPSFRVSNIFNQVNSISSHNKSCGFMCQVNDSVFNHVHSQINDIDGGTVSGFVDGVSAKAQFNNVSSFAVVNSCESPNNGFFSKTTSSSEIQKMSNVVSAVFDKSHSDSGYGCESVISHDSLKSVSNVYYYAPNDQFSPGGTNVSNTNIKSFNNDNAGSIAQIVSGDATNLSEFNYNGNSVMLPVAITKQEIEDMMFKPNQAILDKYDFTNE